MKKFYCGIGLILIALLLLFKDSLMFLSIDFPIWLIICTVIFSIGAVTNFYKKDYMGSFGSLVILFIIMNSYYNFIPISTGILIAAFILISIGLNLIIEDKTTKKSLGNKI